MPTALSSQFARFRHYSLEKAFVKGNQDAALALAAPNEFSFFVTEKSSKVLESIATATRFSYKSKVIEDHYFDTEALSWFNENGSLRLRTYLQPSQDVFFEAIVVTWDREAPDQKQPWSEARTNQVLVQTFRKSLPSQFEQHIKTLRSRGFERVLRLKKTRHSFELYPWIIEEMGADNPDLAGFAGEIGVGRVLGCVDIGLRIVLDELQTPILGYRTVLEIEYDWIHRIRANQLAATLQERLGPSLVPKSKNKIRYFLEDVSSEAKKLPDGAPNTDHK